MNGLHLLGRVLRYVRPFKREAMVALLCTVAVSVLVLLAPWPLQILFDSVLGEHPLPSLVRPLLEPWRDRPYALLGIVVIGGFCLTVLINALKVINSHAETRLSQGMVLDFRSDLFRHAQRLPLAYHDRRRSGTLIFAINFQANSAAGLVMSLLPLGQSALTLVGMFWITATIDPWLAVLTMAVVPFLYLAVGHYIARIQPRLREVRDMEGESLSIIHEAISMIRVILAFCREEHEHDRFRRQGSEAVAARVGVTVRQTAFSLGVNTVTAAGTALVLGVGVWRILDGALTSGQLLVVLAYVSSIYKPLEAITNTVGSLQERFIALEMAFELLDREPSIQNAPDAVRIGRARGEVSYEGVGFAYRGRESTLADISFRAPPGSVVGIVGPTGAGKSTLVSLLPRFYDPCAGHVRLDGRDVRSLDLESLRSQIGLVSQEPLLFSGTIADNIRYGRLDASLADIEAAARAANAHDFVSALPEGYDTPVGEKGVGLSGGERQRIAIARAFLKDAPILVLDEPTSAIDSRTEEVILDALDRLMTGRTTFMIAHRLSTLRRPDLLLVLDRGRVVEQGRLDDLLHQDGLFRQLWNAQHDGPSADGEAKDGVPPELRVAT